jgi:hypothetical protein
VIVAEGNGIGVGDPCGTVGDGVAVAIGVAVGALICVGIGVAEGALVGTVTGVVLGRSADGVTVELGCGTVSPDGWVAVADGVGRGSGCGPAVGDLSTVGDGDCCVASVVGGTDVTVFDGVALAVTLITVAGIGVSSVSPVSSPSWQPVMMTSNIIANGRNILTVIGIVIAGRQGPNKRLEYVRGIKILCGLIEQLRSIISLGVPHYEATD